MSHDDKTIITFRQDRPDPSGSAVQKPSPGGGFQRPKPGGRNAKAAAPTPMSQAPALQPTMGVPPLDSSRQSTPSVKNVTATTNQQSAGFQSTVYINPVVHCANDLIDRMAALRSESRSLGDGAILDPSLLKDDIVRQIRDFEYRCGQAGVDEESVLYSRYVLCTVIDEFATKTPWGGNGVWSSQSLLSQFHDETRGGEKFFQILDHLQTQPATYLNVLELMYVSLSFGFEGKYSLQNRGNVDIENLRDNLFHLMRLQRGEPERDLSPQWQGVSEKRHTLMKHVPVWVVSALAGVVLLVLYSGFSYQLNGSKDDVIASLSAPIQHYLPIKKDNDEVDAVIETPEPSVDTENELEK
ncbi:hypothetical protein A9Q99_02325 [Gammaproteobacteria bacterium 45_16_T64]|nr:hypothetical protein A9Q99_02325 [Gammaproteobacteria bacterium 45_16_T64]